ncbi:MAG TPA: nucleotide exchange factor GrpE [Ktedonobacteraceae bacterium]|jgi:molecular chaperone GrpE (heat shock protein)|nr:nucleotide exchange factor GrpE [Ktedonobacteraceae bacterium]
MEELQPATTFENNGVPNGEAPIQTAEVSQDTALSSSEASTIPPQLLQTLQTLVTEMQELRRDFDTKIKYDESKERQVDSLYQELQTHREGLHFKILRPLFTDLIAVYDDFGKLIESLSHNGVDSSQTLDNLRSFQETIDDILRRNGAESYSLEEDSYTPVKQRVLQVIETNDPAQDKKIARRIRRGFEYEGRVLRPELIAMYKFVPGKE